MLNPRELVGDLVHGVPCTKIDHLLLMVRKDTFHRIRMEQFQIPVERRQVFVFLEVLSQRLIVALLSVVLPADLVE